MMGADTDFDLFPVALDHFRVIVRRGGKPHDAEWMVFQFKAENGRATGFEVPNPKGDRLLGGAERAP